MQIDNISSVVIQFIDRSNNDPRHRDRHHHSTISTLPIPIPTSTTKICFNFTLYYFWCQQQQIYQFTLRICHLFETDVNFHLLSVYYFPFSSFIFPLNTPTTSTHTTPLYPPLNQPITKMLITTTESDWERNKSFFQSPMCYITCVDMCWISRYHIHHCQQGNVWAVGFYIFPCHYSALYDTFQH